MIYISTCFAWPLQILALDIFWSYCPLPAAPRPRPTPPVTASHWRGERYSPQALSRFSNQVFASSKPNSKAVFLLFS